MVNNDPTPCPNPRCSGTLALVLTASNGPVLVCHTCWWMEAPAGDDVPRGDEEAADKMLWQDIMNDPDVYGPSATVGEDES